VGDWFTSDRYFRAELENGRRFEDFMAMDLLCYGFDVQVPRRTFRDLSMGFEQTRYANDPDLVVEGRSVEVKSYDHRFNSVGDFPFRFVITERKSIADRRTGPSPWAYVIVSRMTCRPIVVMGDTRPEWKVRVISNARASSRRGGTVEIKESLLCPIDLAIGWREFIGLLGPPTGLSPRTAAMDFGVRLQDRRDLISDAIPWFNRTV
jgi:hypothetical protein